MQEVSPTLILNVGELPDVVHRISKVSQKILAHDALIVARSRDTVLVGFLYAAFGFVE